MKTQFQKQIELDRLNTEIAQLEAALAQAYAARAGRFDRTTQIGWCACCGKNPVDPIILGEDTCHVCVEGI